MEIFPYVLVACFIYGLYLGRKEIEDIKAGRKPGGIKPDDYHWTDVPPEIWDGDD